MRPVALACGLGLALVFPAIGSAKTADNTGDVDAGQLLANAAKAVKTQDYRGVLVYSHSGELNTLRVFHRYKNGVERERLVSMDGPAREVIRTGSKTVSVLPSKKLVLISEQRKKSLLNRLSDFSVARLRAHYTIDSDGKSRVAGRPCRVIALKPDDRYRYGYRLVVDQKTHLPLKLELRDNGRILEKLLFSQISFPKMMADKLFKSQYDLDGYRVVKHQAIELGGSKDGPSHWHADKLPPGFKLAESGVRRVSDKAQVRQMLFTDGLATVSAFIAPAGLRAPLKGEYSMGAVHAFGRSVDNTQITVVGEVPSATVKMIARNLSPTSGH